MERGMVDATTTVGMTEFYSLETELGYNSGYAVALWPFTELLWTLIFPETSTFRWRVTLQDDD